MSTYFELAASTLPKNVGANGTDGTRISEGQEGHISFGPHFSLEPDDYVAGFYIRRLEGPHGGSLDLDIYDGNRIIAHSRFDCSELFDDIPSLISVSFHLDTATHGIEVRLYVHRHVRIELQKLVVFSTRQRIWSGK